MGEVCGWGYTWVRCVGGEIHGREGVCEVCGRGVCEVCGWGDTWVRCVGEEMHG